MVNLSDTANEREKKESKNCTFECRKRYRLVEYCRSEWTLVEEFATGNVAGCLWYVAFNKWQYPKG